jgi:hypothetical protein
MQRIGDDQTQIRYSIVGRSRGRVTLCAICTVHKEMRSVSFLVESQNQGRRFPGLSLKTASSTLVICALKLSHRFLDLCLKIKPATVCLLCHKTDGRMTRHGACVEI